MIWGLNKGPNIHPAFMALLLDCSIVKTVSRKIILKRTKAPERMQRFIEFCYLVALRGRAFLCLSRLAFLLVSDKTQRQAEGFWKHIWLSGVRREKGEVHKLILPVNAEWTNSGCSAKINRHHKSEQKQVFLLLVFLPEDFSGDEGVDWQVIGQDLVIVHKVFRGLLKLGPSSDAAWQSGNTKRGKKRT